jgi:hypothetical protein
VNTAHNPITFVYRPLLCPCGQYTVHAKGLCRRCYNREQGVVRMSKNRCMCGKAAVFKLRIGLKISSKHEDVETTNTYLYLCEDCKGLEEKQARGY